MGLGDLLGRKGGQGQTEAGRVERLPPRQAPIDELAEAEAETRRMMEEAERSTREFVGAEAGSGRGESSPVVETASDAARKPSQIDRLLAETEQRSSEAKRFESRLNVLIALVVALMLAVLWLGLREG